MTIDIPLSLLRTFAPGGTGCVHRAFNHFIAVGPGWLLLVPVALSSGDLRQVVDGCPVPWDEVIALLDSADHSKPISPEKLTRNWPALALISPYGWRADTITPFPAGSQLAIRFRHPCGIAYAEI